MAYARKTIPLVMAVERSAGDVKYLCVIKNANVVLLCVRVCVRVCVCVCMCVYVCVYVCVFFQFYECDRVEVLYQHPNKAIYKYCHVMT